MTDIDVDINVKSQGSKEIEKVNKKLKKVSKATRDLNNTTAKSEASAKKAINSLKKVAKAQEQLAAKTQKVTKAAKSAAKVQKDLLNNASKKTKAIKSSTASIQRQTKALKANAQAQTRVSRLEAARLNKKAKKIASPRNRRKVIPEGASKLAPVRKQTAGRIASAERKAIAKSQQATHGAKLGATRPVERIKTQMSQQTAQMRTTAQNASAQVEKLSNKYNKLNKIKSLVKTKTQQVNKQLNKTKKVVKGINPPLNKMNSNLNKSGKRWGAFGKKVQAANKKLNNAKKSMKSVGNRKNVDLTDPRGLGVTGLVFGFIGGAAGAIKDQVVQGLKSAAVEAGGIMSQIHKGIVLSGTATANAPGGGYFVDPKLLNQEKDYILTLATKFPHNIYNIAEAYKQVGKALPTQRDVKPVTELVLKLATLEDANPKDVAEIVAKIKAIFGDDITFPEIGDLLLNVDLQSTADLNKITRSFGFAAAAAETFKVNAHELGATLGLLIDRVGTGQGGAGRGFKTLVSDLVKASRSEAAAALGAAPIKVDEDGKIKFKHFFVLLSQIRRAHDELKDAGHELFAREFLESFDLNQISMKSLQALIKVPQADIELAVAGAFTPGSLDALYGEQAKQGQEQIQILTNKIQLLKLAFSTGLLQSIPEKSALLDEVLGISGAEGNMKGILSLLNDLGKAVGEEFLYMLRSIRETVISLQMFLTAGEELTTWAKKNKSAVRTIAKLIVGFTIALGAMAAIFPIAAFFVAMTYAISGLMGVMNSAIVAGFIAKFGGLLPLLGKLIPMFAAVGLLVYSISRMFNVLGEATDRIMPGITGWLERLGVDMEGLEPKTRKLIDAFGDLGVAVGSAAAIGFIIGGPKGAAIAAAIAFVVSLTKVFADF